MVSHVGIAPTTQLWKSRVYLSTLMRQKGAARRELHPNIQVGTRHAIYYITHCKWSGMSVLARLFLLGRQRHYLYVNAANAVHPNLS